MSIRRIIKNVTGQMSLVKCLWRWHPEVAIRYWPIVKQIQNAKFKMPACQRLALSGRQNYNSKLKILEVGSGWLGIAPYLGETIIGLDEDFEGKEYPLLKQLKGSIVKIPFENNSFDFVICVDVLEHLPGIKRIKAIEEILRVAKRECFLALPCGKQSFSQDKQLDTQYRGIFGKPFTFLTEHIKYRLPEKEEIIQLIKLAAKKQKKEIKLEIQGNENLHLRRFLMKGWMTKNFFVDFLFRKAFLLLTPFFIFFDKPSYYRQIFFVKIKKHENRY